jgi:hypothetical protein
MRTTLDIDDDVLEAVEELAAYENKTAGRVLSDLARKALTTPREPLPPPDPDGFIRKNGFIVLPPTGAIVTNALVQRLLDEADLEDAGILKDE